MTSSIANETVDHSKNREPFSFYKFITNKYFLNVVPSSCSSPCGTTWRKRRSSVTLWPARWKWWISCTA